MQLQTYSQYNDSNIVLWRKGTPEDPFILRTDSLPVINNQITLLEIPSYTEKVRISGFTEINQATLEKKRILDVNEFIVDYSIGNIQFHPSHEGKTLVCIYSGRGVILMSASRVYAMVSRNPDVVVTLQDIIDETTIRLKDATDAIAEARTATLQAIEATNAANLATDNANLARDQTLSAINQALDASASTIMIYKPPVKTYAELQTIYPKPENGWRVMIESTGDIYRFDDVTSHSWNLIDNWTGESIPNASDTVDGLFGKEDYTLLHQRTIIFTLPLFPQGGVQNYIIQCPFKGTITEVRSFCLQPGELKTTEFQVEKISSSGFDVAGQWSAVTNSIKFNIGDKKGSTPTISSANTLIGDYFRLRVTEYDTTMKGITVQIALKIKL